MTTPKLKTFVVEKGDKTIELRADRVLQSPDSSRVTFFTGDTTVGSFINIESWYEKPAD